MIRKYAFWVLAFVILFNPNFVLAKDAKQNERDLRPAVLRANFDAIESLGLFSTPREGSLGRDLWDNSRRSVLTELIPLLPEPGTSPVHQRLVMGLLLSNANARLIEDNIETEAGKDLLTLRLEKLNEFGAYKHSAQIYSKLGAEPYHINLARAGMTAMLFNGERSLTCLEFKTMEDRDFDSEFWDEITKYCKYVLAGDDDENTKNARNALKKSSLPTLRNIGENSNYKVSYSKTSFNKISELEKAILVAEDRVLWPKISTSLLKNMPLNHLGIFMSRADLNANEEFLIMVHAVKRGLSNPSLLGKFYDEIFEKELRQRESGAGLGWKSIAYAYHNAQKARQDDEKWEHILSAFSAAKNHEAQSLSPFATVMQTISIEEKSNNVIKKALRIINYAGENIPGRWLKFFSRTKNSTKFDRSLYFLAQIWQETSTQGMLEDPEIQAFLDQNSDKLKLNYFNIIENVDKRGKNIHNADKIYGNSFDLTFTESYVMPMPRVWDRFVNSSQDKRIGEAVLLSTAILRKQSLDDHYPGIVRDVLQSFNNVGLTKTSKLLVLELILEQQ